MSLPIDRSDFRALYRLDFEISTAGWLAPPCRMGMTPGGVFDCVNPGTRDIEMLERKGIVYHEQLGVTY